MDIIKLIQAAQTGNVDIFEIEWLAQGGSPDGGVINSSFLSYAGMNIDDAREALKTSKKSKKNTGSYSSGGGSTAPPSGPGDFARKLLQTQYAEEPSGALPGELMNIESLANVILDSENNIKGLGQAIKDMLSNAGQQLLVQFQQQSTLLTEMNTKAGMLGDLSEGFRREITEASPEAERLGITFGTLRDAVVTVTEQSGKMKLLGRDTINDMTQASLFVDDMGSLAEMGKNFQLVGLGISDMSREITKAGKSAIAVGLNARTTTKLLDENLKNINMYGFKNGVAGLSDMVKKSIEFRMNMESVMSMVKEVWSPEGALDVVANLQMIGGAFGDLNDPIKLMYMATNNVEGLQDALIGASKTLVTFNQEQGKFEVTGANLRRAKEMADTLGISMDQLTSGAVAAMERVTAASDLMSTGLIMDDGDKEFLTNLAQMKDGKMVIEVPESLQTSLKGATEIALDSMTQEQTQLLLDQREAFKQIEAKDIAMQQVTLVENINRQLNYLLAIARVEAGEGKDKLVQSLHEELGIDLNKVKGEIWNLADNGGERLRSLVKNEASLVPNSPLLQNANVNTGANALNLPAEKATGTNTGEKKESTVYVKQTVDITSNIQWDELKRKWSIESMKNPKEYIWNDVEAYSGNR